MLKNKVMRKIMETDESNLETTTDDTTLNMKGVVLSNAFRIILITRYFIAPSRYIVF